MIALSSLILEAAEGIVDFGCRSASIFCTRTLTTVKEKMHKNMKKKKKKKKEKEQNEQSEEKSVVEGHGTWHCLLLCHTCITQAQSWPRSSPK